MIGRRRALALAGALAGGATLGTPALVAAQSQRVLRFIPQTDITGFDPVYSSTQVTRNYAYLVYDTLFGLDKNLLPQPQMAESWQVDADQKRWSITLRPGLIFHDGTPVLARDCVASIQRWGARDSFGKLLMAATDEVSAADDRTIRFRMKRPFPLLPFALAKSTANMVAIMPERLAKLSPHQQVTEVMGSGPYKLMQNESVIGARVVFAKHEAYRPRPDGELGWTAGPKVAHFDRVEWVIITDAATAAGALQNGEVDWWETPTPDYLPMLTRHRNIAVSINDTSGGMPIMRFNFLNPPFDNPEIRRIVLRATSQMEFMNAMAGTDPALYRTGVGFFPPGTPYASDVGLSGITDTPDMEQAKRALSAAGYKGERIVVLGPADRAAVKAASDVAADQLARMGFNVDYQVADWGTVSARVVKKEPPEQGGWSVYFGIWSGLSVINPAVHQSLQGTGNDAWTGWPTLPELESLRQSWLDAPDLAAQQRVAREVQARAFQDVPYVPLGQFFAPIAHRKDLTGIVQGFPVFWNVRRG
ncbi:ABC transporter substrate-binding protein [Roseomonas aerophila]|uniref:ABC transporter substrate-binding protein n=1 Tax=Teichococcus aerophilus TaxID=1224513 RepID=A0ABR7RLW4_9PROT|nr:ABC transporter substrate-binding protein [Pseudoroseomonas aerophila]MBC9207423.1 ABC transporter substrate-binding protein [Pseudoroseomonas aerophila]